MRKTELSDKLRSSKIAKFQREIADQMFHNNVGAIRISPTMYFVCLRAYNETEQTPPLYNNMRDAIFNWPCAMLCWYDIKQGEVFHIDYFDEMTDEDEED